VNSELDIGLGIGVARRLRVLVAEDDVHMRELVAHVLRREGLEVEEIPDGQRLLVRLVEAFVPRRVGAAVDLVVSDVRMPFCSGLDVLKSVRLSRCPVPVLLMTAFGEQGLERRVRELGGLLLDKPFTPLALRTMVREILGRG
jgi:DNA-binding response OmpR family regulator